MAKQLTGSYSARMTLTRYQHATAMLTCWLCCFHRPLVLGKRSSEHGDEYCVASEDCAFGPIGFQRVRDVLPGEMIVITEDGNSLRCIVQT